MSALPMYIPPPEEQGTWLSKEEVVRRTGVSSRSLERYAAAGHALSRQLPERGRNGRPICEYLIETLPVRLRAKLEAPKPALKVMRPAGPSQDSAPLFNQVAERPGQRIGLSPEAERQAAERLSVIRPLLDYADPSNRSRYAALKLADGRTVKTAELLAEYIAETRLIGGKCVATRTLRRWVEAFREGGLPALARKSREDKGKSQFFTAYPAAAQLAAAEYHKPYATVARAYDAIIRDQELLRIAPDDLPSYDTVRRYLEALPKPMAILAREGQRAWNEQCAPHVARAYTDIPAGSIYVADHQIHDCEVRNDCFPGTPEGAAIRLRFTCIMDMRSRKIVGYCWAVEGDWRSIVTALRRAVERFGPCEVFYCDNGADFKKVAKGAENMRPGFRRASEESIQQGAKFIQDQGAIQQLGSKVQFCLPYHAQSKPIERVFGFVHGRLDGIMHTYLTGNSYNRPDAAILAGTQHRKLLKMGRAEESTLLPASVFIKLAETWIEQDYNAWHKHSGQGMDGRTPNAVFDAGYPAESRRKTDPAVLNQLLFERRTALVRRTAVTIDKRRYMPLPGCAESWANLHNAHGRQIALAFDPLDPTNAIALDEHGHKMADLVAETLTQHPLVSTPESREPIRQMSQIRGRLKAASSIAIATMHEGVALAGHKSAIEHLADRALVTIPVDDLTSKRIVRPMPNPVNAVRPSPRQVAASLYRQQKEQAS